MDEVAAHTPESGRAKDHYAVLTRMLAAVSGDHGQLRHLVYEFARRELRRNLYPQFEDGDWAGIQEQMRALEAAIERVEDDCMHRALTFAPEPPIPHYDRIDGVVGSPPDRRPGSRDTSRVAVFPETSDKITRQSPPQTVFDGDVFLAVARFSKRTRSALWWKFQLVLAVVLGLIIYAAVDSPSLVDLLRSQQVAPSKGTAPSNIADVNAPLDDTGSARAHRPNVPNVPLPSEYGAFALNAGQLTELELLPMRVPDPRVAISPVISTPSRAHIPTGKLELVLFRRDLVNTAPDRVMLRVVARVVRALKFDSGGRAMTTNINDAWVVRSNSYQMRVAPIADNPEMILIRPDPPDLILPAGRYALVLKGAAYDFTLDGPNADTAHCLERTDVLVSPIYTECRTL
jgi:hypothetical protein